MTVDAVGDLDSAGFVQVMTGQVSDPDPAKQIMAEQPDMRALRPDVLGNVSIGHEDGKWTMVIYFTSEATGAGGRGRARCLPKRWRRWSRCSRCPSASRSSSTSGRRGSPRPSRAVAAASATFIVLSDSPRLMRRRIVRHTPRRGPARRTMEQPHGVCDGFRADRPDETSRTSAGKRAQLGELSRIDGIRVPAGFCVTTDAFRRVVAELPSIDDQLDRLRGWSRPTSAPIRTLSAQIRRRDRRRRRCPRIWCRRSASRSAGSGAGAPTRCAPARRRKTCRPHPSPASTTRT